MKKIILIFTIIPFFLNISYAQSVNHNLLSPGNDADVPLIYRYQLVTKDSMTYLGGEPIASSINEAELVFEGRVLSVSKDTTLWPGVVFTYRHVLVLKQFKGKFKSDTITVGYYSGRDGVRNSAVQKDIEGVFFVSTNYARKKSIHIPNVYWLVYSEKQGFIKICDIKNLTKDLYEPIEAVTGQKYIDVHPNTCATQQKK